MEQPNQALEQVTIWTVLAEGAEALEARPDEAERLARVALASAPGQQQALQLLIAARRLRGDVASAREKLETMAAESPGIAAIQYELAVLLAESGEHAAAVRHLSRVVELEPAHTQAWGALGDALLATGDKAGAASAYARQFASSVLDLKILEEVSTLGAGEFQNVAAMLGEYLNIHPTDLAAQRLLGQTLLRNAQIEAAEQAFVRALKLDPSFHAARADYVSILHLQRNANEEIRQLDLLLEVEPGSADFRYLKAIALYTSGQIESALAYCEELIRAEPKRAKFRLAYAYALRFAGRRQDCIAAFRDAIALEGGFGEAWWGLASLKTVHFTPSDIHAMRTELARQDLPEGDRQLLHFALGKALDDCGDFEGAFGHYSIGNAEIRAANPFDFQSIAQSLGDKRLSFRREFFVARSHAGNLSREPIFILGLPRSGTTLVEQILASHSFVEGCGELPGMSAVAHRLESTPASRAGRSDEENADIFSGEDLRALGEDYLNRSRAWRHLERPFFTDKLPGNFHHLGLICSMFPNATIIDVRRHPLACCFSNFTQVFPVRCGPSYDLTDMGRYYSAYVEMVGHFDRVLPGRIHRVFYEDLVQNPESEIRRLLDCCGLSFEEQCLRFYDTDRAIQTISSEQVRQPMYQNSIGHWHRYEQWLDPLKTALGPVLTAWRTAPEEFQR